MEPLCGPEGAPYRRHPHHQAERIKPRQQERRDQDLESDGRCEHGTHDIRQDHHHQGCTDSEHVHDRLRQLRRRRRGHSKQQSRGQPHRDGDRRAGQRQFGGAGDKTLHLNQGDEYVHIAGVIRTADIATDNTVTSDKIADAHMQPTRARVWSTAPIAWDGWRVSSIHRVAPF